ncbi:hypothetical protein [Haloferula sp. BvORR071]|uniref:hypothetical protein n=1 Tax=Haloferula sp. BvORR071 TaxID=1396141 RepID=UPI00055193DE|nr:hypothetical protein [Haloferula sp. BvORR071]
MKTQGIALALTAINLVLLAFILMRLRPAVAEQGVVPVLRARSLEIVDEQGRVRSQILVTTPTTMPDGKSYPEGALFRLIDPNGRPVVKIGGSVDGSGISLAGDSERRDWSGVQILAEGAGSSVKLTNKDGRQEVLVPK